MSNDYKIDIRNLNPDEIVANTGSDNVWVLAEVEEKIHFLSYTLEPQSPEPEIITVPAAVIKFSEPCLVSKPSGYASFQESMLMIMSVLGVAIPTKSGGPGGWDPSDGQTNSLISIPIVSGGSGYTQEGTTININPGTATAIAEIFAGGYPSGAITSIIVTDPGSGYLTVPSVTLNGDGVGAVLGPPSMGRIPKAICGVPSGDFSIFNLNVDNNAGNKFGFFPQYVPPTAAVIPLKSNIRTYGPYVSDNFATDFGGIDADTDNDLAPWVFGSLAAANAAGNSIANEFTAQPLKISEAGTVSTLGFPSLSFGQQLAGSGSYLNNINMTFGANGIKTTLDFQSFNPKFGSLSNIYRNQIKNNIKNKQKQLRFIRNQNIISQKINRGIKRITSNAAQSPLNQPARGASLQRCLVGEIYDWQTLKTIPNKRNVEGSGQRIVVGMDTLGDIVQEMRYDYEKKAYISLDGLYSPVSISGGNAIAGSGASGVLPRLAILPPISGDGIKYSGVPGMTGIIGYLESSKIRTTGTNRFEHHSSTLYAMPPYFTGICEDMEFPSGTNHKFNNIKIHNLYLNPLANPTGIPYFTGTCAGHNIDLVGRETGIPPSGGLMNSLFPESSGRNKYSDDYRFLGMRGPLVLHSWGYDTEGKPIPNYIDNENLAKSGIFLTSISGIDGGNVSGVTDMFMQDWLQKPATWPVGPVDLRFDRERGVWVSPPPFRIITARIISTVPPFGSGEAFIVTNDTVRSNIKRLTTNTGNIIPDGSGCIFKALRCLFENDDPQELMDAEEILKKSTATLLGVHIPMTEIQYVESVVDDSDNIIATKKRIKVASINMSDPDPDLIPIYDCTTYINFGASGDWVVYAPCGPMAGALQIYTDAEYGPDPDWEPPECNPQQPAPVIPIAPPENTTILYNDQCYHLVGLIESGLPPDPAAYVPDLPQESIGNDCAVCPSGYVTYTNCLEDSQDVCDPPIGYKSKAVASIAYSQLSDQIWNNIDINAVYSIDGNCWKITSKVITSNFTYPESYELLPEIISEQNRVNEDDCNKCLTKSIWLQNCCCTDDDIIKTKKINIICPKTYESIIDGLVINKVYPIVNEEFGVLSSGCYRFLGTSETLLTDPSVYMTLDEEIYDIVDWNLDNNNPLEDCDECADFIKETYNEQFECFPSGASGAMIRVVDRIGTQLSRGKNIYAQYDTTTGEYIALGYQGTTNNKTAIVVGDVSADNSGIISMTSVSLVYGDISVTSTIELTNPLGIYLPPNESFKGWATINFGGG
jgi:hypothetical protein